MSLCGIAALSYVENVTTTHKCRKNPLSESSSDLLVANRCFLSIHIEVKLLCFAGQEPLQSNKDEGAVKPC